MIIERLIIHNYKTFKHFDISFNEDINILVGDNDSGKSTILEAIYLALTKRLNGRYIESELNNYTFNDELTRNWIKKFKDGDTQIGVFESYIELYFKKDLENYHSFVGSNNSLAEDHTGVKLEITLNPKTQENLETLFENENSSIPIEFFVVNWIRFDGNQVSVRSLPNPSFIDASTIRLHNGTDYYLQGVINNTLDSNERDQLSLEYRKLKEIFSAVDSIKKINDDIKEIGYEVTDKNLSIALDISQKSNWETNVIPHLNEIPLSQVGKGAQTSLKIMLALQKKKGNESNTILIEEPENHLSFSSMRKLISKIETYCDKKQVFLTTHSSYILNKLDLNNLRLINKDKNFNFQNLPNDTGKFFKKISGYNTLRIILSEKTILVEGPSDELIVNKAYMMKNSGKKLIDVGVDIISVGTTFKRFLDISKDLNKKIAVIRDNDHDYQINVIDRYSDYVSDSINIFSDEKLKYWTLEPSIIFINTLEIWNAILNKEFSSLKDVDEFARKNKTEFALSVFEADEDITMPGYIQDAIDFITE